MRSILEKTGAVALALILLGAGCGAAPSSGTVSTGGSAETGAPARGSGACDNAYFPSAQGTKLTYATDFAGRAGSYSLEVQERTSTNLKLLYTFTVAEAPGGALRLTQDVRCEGGALVALSYADIGGALSGGRITAQTTRAEGELMPRALAVGGTWESSFDITATVSLPEPIGSRTMASTIANRHRVVGRERVTVPAGTFDAFKIETTVTVTSEGFGGVAIPPQTVTTTSWFAEDVGMVKSEGGGGTTQLTSIER